MKRLAAWTVTLVMLASCTGGGPSSPASRDPAAGGTLRVGMTGAAYFAMDPQNEYAYQTWELFRCCLLRTLMSYPGTSGIDGTEPQPDLAAGPPEVSTDGRTWTFHLRAGLHWGPPLQDVPITSGDIVRALLRAGDPATANPTLGSLYLSDIAGFSRYMSGKADSISGVETPDPLTLVIHQIRPDATLPYQFTMGMTAPIPPSPSDPSARYGVAAGHGRSQDPSKQDGYGRFLVSSGPYMFDGESAVDFSLPPDEQTPAEGFDPWRFDQYFTTLANGSLTLVRNPSWDQATDPLRAALPDRIEITGSRPGAVFRQLGAGDLDVVFDETPPPAMLRRYLDDPSLRPLVQTIDTGNLVMADFILTQPPFDDVAVRRAVADALERRAMLGPIARGYPVFSAAILANHYAPDANEEGLAAGWDPFPGESGKGDLGAARREMAHSRYAAGGLCVSSVCSGLTVALHHNMAPVAGSVRESLDALGIHARVVVPDDFYGSCLDPPPSWHLAMCVGDGWFPDVPSVGNLIFTNFGGPAVSAPFGISRMGATVAQLAKLDTGVRSVPTIAPQIEGCNQQLGPRGIACWTSLDQYLVSNVMPAVPIAFGRVIRITAPSVRAFSWDIADQAPALDRLGVSGS